MTEEDNISKFFSKLLDKVNKQLNEKLTEGLKKKGFDFDNESALHEFVKNHCRCENNVDLKQRTYYVGEVPFLVNNYDTSSPFTFEEHNKKVNVKTNFGTYEYL